MVIILERWRKLLPRGDMNMNNISECMDLIIISTMYPGGQMMECRYSPGIMVPVDQLKHNVEIDFEVEHQAVIMFRSADKHREWEQ
jgi:hypothetical protein